MEEKYDVPEEVATLMDKVFAAKKLRSLYVSIPFGLKKAKRCASDAEKYFRQFWGEINTLYPELKGKRLSYNAHEKYVAISQESEGG